MTFSGRVPDFSREQVFAVVIFKRFEQFSRVNTYHLTLFDLPESENPHSRDITRTESHLFHHGKVRDLFVIAPSGHWCQPSQNEFADLAFLDLKRCVARGYR